MSLEQLFQTVESQLCDLGKRLWREDARIEMRYEADELERDLQEAYRVLSGYRALVTDRRRRLASARDSMSAAVRPASDAG